MATLVFSGNNTITFDETQIKPIPVYNFDIWKINPITTEPYPQKPIIINLPLN